MPISSTGLGSGLDVESIVRATMAVERLPANLITNTNTGLKSQLSSYGQLQSYVSALQDKSAAVTSSTLWGQTAATSGDASVATVTTGSGAAEGKYSLSVQSLANSQTTSTVAFPSTSHSLGQGQITIELGSWTGDPATFGLQAGSTSVTVEIGPGETSLAAIRDKINAAGAGVTATIIKDASGIRLSFRSTESGVENGFRIAALETVQGDDGGLGLNALNFDPEHEVPGMTLNQAASNAKATLNGIEIESASNSLSDVSDGLTINLLKTTSSPVEISVARDSEAMKTAINGFVTAYNDLSTFIATQTKYDSESKVAGKLQGDRTVIGLQGQLRAVLREASTASEKYGLLSDVGIEVQKNGTLQVNSSKLNDALAHVTDLKKVLTSSGDGSATSTGLIYRFKVLADQVLGFEGALDTRTAGIKSTIDRNEKRADAMETRLEATEKRIRAQYQALDTNMARLTNLNSYLTGQLNLLSRSSG